MGGSVFGKTFGKVTTKIVDPFGIGNTKFGRTVKKVVDPSQQQQMLNNMRQQQQAKLANIRAQGQAYPTAAPTQSVEIAQAPTTTTPVALAQSKVSDTTAPADMPTEFIYKPATATTKSVAANTFQMPDMSNIKFGGA